MINEYDKAVKKMAIQSIEAFLDQVRALFKKVCLDGDINLDEDMAQLDQLESTYNLLIAVYTDSKLDLKFRMKCTGDIYKAYTVGIKCHLGI